MVTVVTNLSALAPFTQKLKARNAVLNGVFIDASFGQGVAASRPRENGFTALLDQHFERLMGCAGQTIMMQARQSDFGGGADHWLAWDGGTNPFAGIWNGLGGAGIGYSGTAQSQTVTGRTYPCRYIDIVYTAFTNGGSLVASAASIPAASATFNLSDAAAPAEGASNNVATLDCGYEAEHALSFYQAAAGSSKTTWLEAIRCRRDVSVGWFGHNMGSAYSAHQLASTADSDARRLSFIGARVRADGTRLMVPDIVTFGLGGNDFTAYNPTDVASYNAAVASYQADVTELFTAWATLDIPIVFFVFPRRKPDAGTAGVNDGAATDAFMRAGLTAAHAANPNVIGIDMTDLWGGTRAGAETAGWLSTGVPGHPTTEGHASIFNEIVRALDLPTYVPAVARDAIRLGASFGNGTNIYGISLVYHVGDTGPDPVILTQDAAGNPLDLTQWYSGASLTYTVSGTPTPATAAFTKVTPPDGGAAVPAILGAAPPTGGAGGVPINVKVHLTTPAGKVHTVPQELTWTLLA